MAWRSRPEHGSVRQSHERSGRIQALPVPRPELTPTTSAGPSTTPPKKTTFSRNSFGGDDRVNPPLSGEDPWSGALSIRRKVGPRAEASLAALITPRDERERGKCCHWPRLPLDHEARRLAAAWISAPSRHASAIPAQIDCRSLAALATSWAFDAALRTCWIAATRPRLVCHVARRAFPTG